MKQTNLTVYTGLAATGKTSLIIKSMNEHREGGGNVVLFLSGEHPELTNRPNVRPGGLMGCRDPRLNFEISHVLKTRETIERLTTLGHGDMAAFDEAQFFGPEIVDAWHIAAKNGVRVLVGTPSNLQLNRLRDLGHTPTEITAPCKCGKRNATAVVYEENMTYPEHLCDECLEGRHKETLGKLFDEIAESDPFPGEKKTYQPFHAVPMEGWDFVRPDSMARYELIKDAVLRHPALEPTTESASKHYTYMDLGCCSGFFCDAMTNIGFSSTGVDVTKNFINWADRIAKLKGHNIKYVCEDAKSFITGSDDLIDVTSSFATIQWVMTQQGYEAGVECFRHLFDRTRHICIVEMGYTLEDIYKDRIPDKPREIDRDWVLDIMQKHGNFAEIETYPAGDNGIWRDVFIGYKEAPAPRERQLENQGAGRAAIASHSQGGKLFTRILRLFLGRKRS